MIGFSTESPNILGNISPCNDCFSNKHSEGILLIEKYINIGYNFYKFKGSKDLLLLCDTIDSAQNFLEKLNPLSLQTRIYVTG